MSGPIAFLLVPFRKRFDYEVPAVFVKGMPLLWLISVPFLPMWCSCGMKKSPELQRFGRYTFILAAAFLVIALLFPAL